MKWVLYLYYEKFYKMKIVKLSRIKREAVIKLIKKYIQNFQSTLTAKEIVNKINYELNTSNYINTIRGWMKMMLT